jgi:hypothetical protein
MLHAVVKRVVVIQIVVQQAVMRQAPITCCLRFLCKYRLVLLLTETKRLVTILNIRYCSASNWPLELGNSFL